MRELAEPLDGPSLDAFRRMAGAAGVCLVGNLPRLGGPGDASGARRRVPGSSTPPWSSRRTASCSRAYDKTHLFDREKAVFTPGAALSRRSYGRGVRFGVLCCSLDIELPEPARTLALRGAQCLLVPSANMEPWGEHHRAYVRARALENHAFVAYANAVGPGVRLRVRGRQLPGRPARPDPLRRRP